MPYIGKSPNFGVRNRFVYLASASDTSVSGADANGATLTFTDGAYVDVYLNGVLLKPTTDYNTSTANTIAGISSMSANDEVTVIVYDIFTVADAVSASSGGTFGGDIVFGGNVSGLDVNGTEIILDADGDTSITADTDDRIDFKVGGSDKVHILSTGQFAIGTTTAPVSEAQMVISGDGTTDESPFIEFVNTSAGNDDTIGGFLSVNSTDSVAEITARRESAADDAFLFFGTQKTGGSLTERFRILSGGNQVGKNGFFKASNASNQYYNGTDPSSGNWHEFNSGIGNEQILAITNHNTGTDNEGFVVRHVANTNNTSSGFISCANDVNGTKFKVEGNGNVESATDSYGAVSDERLKSDIKDANSQWDDIKQLRFRNFKKYNTEDLVQLGLIAQEAEKISPNIIYTSKPTALDIKHDASFGTLYEDGDTIPDGKKVGDVKEIREQVKHIKSSVLYMKAVKALQEAMTRIETLEAKVKTLESK